MTLSSSPGGRFRRHPWLAALLVFGVLAVAPVGFAFAVGQDPPAWLPRPLAHFAFDVRLATAPTVKKLSSLTRGSPLDKRVHLARGGGQVSFMSGDVRLVGTLYDAASRRGSPARDVPGARPAVLLLHGSTPEGRRMGLYRMLADGLAARGYIVLALDQRGFGQSGRPLDIARPEAWDYTKDVHRATAWLGRLPAIDRGRIHIVGHSFGANVALTASLSDPIAATVAIIGPRAPQPNPDPAVSPQTASPAPQARPRLTYMARRAQRYASVTTVPGVSYTGMPVPLEALAEPGHPLASPDHKPVLIVSSEYEPAHELAALTAWQQRIAGPSRLLVADRADHYLNSAGFGAVVIYDVRVLGALVAELDGWLGGAPGGCAGASGCIWPGVPFVPLAALLLLAILALLSGVVLFLARGRSNRPEPATPRP